MAQPLSLFHHIVMASSSQSRKRQLLGGDGLETSWSMAAWEGRRAEDRVVAVRRPWPSDTEGPGLEPPPSICQTSTCSSGPGASAVSAAAGLLGRGLAAAVNGGGSLLRGSTASSAGGGGSGAGTPRGVTPKAAAAAARPSYQLLAAFDGHNGAEAARFAEHSIVPIVEIFLPPWSALSLFPTEPAELAAQLQQALALAFLELHRQFAMAGCLGGTTATVVLQVGRLVTVAGVGSSRCLLFSGAPGEAPLPLTDDHVIHTHLRERQRLLSTGRQVAAVDVSGSGPAPTPVRGSGVLRLWPGGLTLSRSIGDFNIGQAVLPLPHIKQVLLPRTGGRLVLATDGVWSQAAGRALTAMWQAPLKTAAHEVIKGLTGRTADASIIVADVLPPRTTFQEVCKRQEALAARGTAPAGSGSIAGISKGAGQAVMRVLKLGRSKSTPTMQQGAAAAGGASQPAAPKLLMDVDTADLLGLMPPVTGSPTRSGSFGSSGSSGWGGSPPGGKLRQPVVPLWFDEQLSQQMQASLVESYQLWHLARRRIKAAEVAALSEADLLERRTSRSETDLAWLEAAAERAVAAADAEMLLGHAAAGTAGTAGTAAGGYEGELQSPFAPAPDSPLAPAFAADRGFSLSPDAPLVLRSASLAAGAAGTAPAGGAAKLALQKQRSLPASPFASLPPPASTGLLPSPYASQPSPAAAPAAQRRAMRSDSARTSDDAVSVASEETVVSMGGGSVRRVSFNDPADTVDPLSSPRRRLPPLRKQVSLPPGRGGIPRSPASAGSSQAAATPSEPGTGRSVARSLSASGRPPLPRSALLGAVAGSSSSRTVAPSTPRLEDLADVHALPRRRRAPGELVGSPETRWRTAYNLSAGMFTKAGSGYSRRNLLPAEGMDSWVESQCGVAEQFIGRPRSRAASFSSLPC